MRFGVHRLRLEFSSGEECIWLTDTAPSHGAGGGGANISFCPPPRNLERAQRKICVESARNSIAPNIPLEETGQVRKIGASRLSKGAPPIQGPSQIGLLPKNIPPVETGQVKKLESLGSQRGLRRFRGYRKLVCPPLENIFRRHCSNLRSLVSIAV